MELTDSRYQTSDGIATITIDRPERYNAFRARTVDEMIHSFKRAWVDRIVGEKRAREIWYLCRQYTAEQMQDWGLVNAVVEPDELMDEARAWAREILAKSPTAIRFLKHSFNAEHEGIAGISQLSFDALEMFVRTEEAEEGVKAFGEKRDPDFGPYR